MTRRKPAHRTVITATRTTPTGWTAVTFGCSCGAYRGDQTVGPDPAAARRAAAGHVATHARITRGAVLPL